MAGIQHADSFVADSTISPSSPAHSFHGESNQTDASDVVEPQVPLKRVVRTYGKPKSDVDLQDNVDVEVTSRSRIFKTAPSDADDEVIPESDDATDTAPKFTGFAWRAQLKAIDDGMDMVSDPSVLVVHRTTTPTAVAEDGVDAMTEADATEINDAFGPTPSSESLFDGTLTSLLSSDMANRSSPLSERHFFEDGSNRPLIVDSSAASESDTTSPQHPYPINSPKRRSSVTPPTSPLGQMALEDAPESGEESTGSDKQVKKDAGSKLRAGKGKGKGQQRSKTLTRKEMMEMRKESARLLADRQVSIQTVKARPTHTIASLFDKLKHSSIVTKRDSDPIASFSSPGNGRSQTKFGESSAPSSPSKLSGLLPNFITSAFTSSTSRPHVSISHDFQDKKHDDDGEEEHMPAPDVILREHEEKRRKQQEKRPADTEKKAKELEVLKRQALKTAQLRNSSAGGNQSDTDDDLEVEELVITKSGNKTTKPSKDNKVVASLALGGIGEKVTRRSGLTTQKSLELAARPAFTNNRKALARKRGQGVDLSQQQLNNMLLDRADKQGGAIESHKQEEWVKAGGSLKRQSKPDIEGTSALDWLQKGLTREDAMEVEDEDEDDTEYKPNDAEGEHGRLFDIEDSEVEARDNVSIPEHFNAPSDEDEDEEADKENHRPPPRRSHVRAVIDSDSDEEDSADQPVSHSPFTLVSDTGFISSAGDSPGGDKENRADLAYSFSENKENESVPRHHERGRIIADDEQPDGLSPSSPVQTFSTNAEANRKPLGRLDAEIGPMFGPASVTPSRETGLDRVLQVLHEEDKESTFVSPGRGRKFHRRSSSAPSFESENLDGPTLVSPNGFSQLLATEGVEEVGPSPMLGKIEFSQFFTQGDRNEDRILATPSKGKVKQHLSDLAPEENDFQFTQPNGLLPSVKISESQRREVDEMFGKDQEFKLDEARRSKKEPQTPDTIGMRNMYLGPFVPSQGTQLSPQSIRRPLETLSLDPRGVNNSPENSPQPIRLGRLSRERPQRQLSSSPSPGPSSAPRNAFNVLRDAAAKNKQREVESKRKLEDSEYVDAAAQESDEELMVGFGGAKPDDDEEIGDEDPNAIVEGLVDDNLLDENAQAVLEKHLEHKAADDAELEKLHQDAVQGKLRGKRRDRGIGFDDSDSDEETLKQPKYYHKKRRIEGDALESYGTNPETRPFYDEYQSHLVADDDADFAFLNKENDTFVEDKEMNGGGSDDESPETIAPAVIRRELVERIKQGSRSTGLEVDLDDADWVDSEDHDMTYLNDVQVADGPLHSTKGATSTTQSTIDHLDFRIQDKKVVTNEHVQLKAWASQELRTHSTASGRGGFSRKEEPDSIAPRRVSKLAPIRVASKAEEKAIPKHSSLISQVGKRKGFED